MNYSEHKEKDNTTDYEEICGSNYTGTAIFPIFLSQFMSDFLFLLDCCFVTIKDLCFEMFVRDRRVSRQMYW